MARSISWPWAGLTMPLAVLSTILALSPASATAATARSCRSYPRPGTALSAAVPVALRAEYAVLARAPTAADQIALARLGSLPESGIVVSGIRFLGPVGLGARAYLVPAEHLLTMPLEPVRCVAPARRGAQAVRLPRLRREYARRALCLVIVYRSAADPTCQAAPGTVAPFLYASGVPGLGIAPDGVSQVRVRYRGHADVRVRVRDNFWSVDDRALSLTPCGLEWLSGTGTVLRTVARCTVERDRLVRGSIRRHRARGETHGSSWGESRR